MPRLRQWTRPRSLLLHVAFVVVAGGCLIAGWWQVHRAMQGNLLSYLYSVEWPAFAVIAGIGWWLLVHDTPEEIAERKAHHARMRQASAAVAAKSLPPEALAITAGSREIGPGRMLAAPGVGPQRRVTAAIGAISEGPDGLTPVPVEPGHEELEPHDDESVEAYRAHVADYNRYLALLSARGKAKTWRNPRGF